MGADKSIQEALAGIPFDAVVDADDAVIDALVCLRIMDTEGKTWVVPASSQMSDNVVIAGLMMALTDSFRPTFNFDKPYPQRD